MAQSKLQPLSDWSRERFTRPPTRNTLMRMIDLGDIPGRTEETIAKGLEFKRKRVMAGLTLGAAAVQMGISAAKLSKIERGIPV